MAIKSGMIWKFLGKWANEKKLLKELVVEDQNTWIVAVLAKKYRDTVSSVLDARFSPHISSDSLTTVTDIGSYIDHVVEEVQQALVNVWKNKWTFKNVTSFKYRMFLKWMLGKLEQKWFTADVSKLKDVPDEHGEWIFNILQDRALTSFFMISKAFWLLDYSKNRINTFPKENEIKVLEVSRDEIKTWLEDWEDVEILEDEDEVDIVDEYYDDINLRLDRQKVFGTKRSFRVRTKKYKWKKSAEKFYTIKRKEDDKKKKKKDAQSVNSVETFNQDNFEPRNCDEKEFQIKKPKIFNGFLESIWLRNSRTKRKNRKSYSIRFEFEWELVEAKLDIDKYKWIPEFLEIECDNNEAIPFIIKKLWLDIDKHGQPRELVILKVWSRWLFRYYGKEDDYEKNYMVNEETWEIQWYNWDIWNSKIHKPIYKRNKK